MMLPVAPSPCRLPQARARMELLWEGAGQGRAAGTASRGVPWPVGAPWPARGFGRFLWPLYLPCVWCWARVCGLEYISN